MLNHPCTINMPSTIINFDNLAPSVHLLCTVRLLILAVFLLCMIKSSCTFIRYPRVRRNMKLTQFTVLRQNITYWLLLRYNLFYMLSYSILWLIFCFGDAVICVIKGEIWINKIYVIKAKYKTLVIVNLGLFLYANLLCSFRKNMLPISSL